MKINRAFGDKIRSGLGRLPAKYGGMRPVPSLIVDSRLGNLEDMPFVNFSRASKKWIVGADGLLKEVPANSLPPSFDPVTGEILGWYLEEQRINSLLDSRDMTTGNWFVSGASVTSRDAVGIDGVANKACTLTDDDSGSAENVQQAATIADDNNTHIASIFVKKDNDETRFIGVRFRLENGTTTVNHRVHVNTKTGAKADDQTDGTSFVEDWGDFWRVWIKVANNSTGNTSARLFAFPAISTTLGTLDNSATGSAIFDQAQVELNATFPTSPIITGASAVTRSADVDTLSDISWFNEKEGTIIAEFSSKYAGDVHKRPFVISDGSNNNRHFLTYQTGSKVFCSAQNGGTLQASIGGSGTEVSFGETVKLAYGYKKDDFVLVLNGSIEGTDSAGTPPTGLTEAALGYFGYVSSGYLNGYIKSLLYYPNRLSNTHGKQFTTQ